jgi:rhodanese-related sulfurtransferase
MSMSNRSSARPTGLDASPRRSVREALFIILLGTALGLAANALSPRGIPLVGDFSRGAALANRSEEELRALPAEIDLAHVKDVVAAIGRRSAAAAGGDSAEASPAGADTSLAKALAANATLLDARTADVYAAGHIPGALNLPAADFEAVYPGLKAEIAAASLLVVYCDGGDCELSHDLAAVLKDLGHGPVQLFAGGFDAWMEAGNDMREGPEP